MRNIFVAYVLTVSIGSCAITSGREATGEHNSDAKVATNMNAAISDEASLK